MPDDLLTTVKAWLRKLDTRLIASKQPETDTLAVILEDLPCTVVDWLRALLVRCEAAEDERDTWHKRFAQLESHRASCCWRMEQERDAAIAAQIAAQVEAGKWRTDFDAARAEAARLRDARADDVALVARLSHQVVALRDAITRVLDGPHYIDRDYQDVLLAALNTPAREGGEGR